MGTSNNHSKPVINAVSLNPIGFYIDGCLLNSDEIHETLQKELQVSKFAVCRTVDLIKLF